MFLKLFLFFTLFFPFTKASENASIPDSVFFNSSLYISSYFLPKRTRCAMVKQFASHSLLDHDKLYIMATKEGLKISKRIFDKAIRSWMQKEIKKKLLNFFYPIDISSLQMVSHKDIDLGETFAIIDSKGIWQEFIQNTYYCFKVFSSWMCNAESNRFIFQIYALLKRIIIVLYGPYSHEEAKLYCIGKRSISYPSLQGWKNYLEWFSSTDFPLSQRIATLMQENKSIAFTDMFNPYDFNPSKHQNVFKHALALQQWKRIQNIRLKDENLNDVLERLILVSAARAHAECFLSRCQKFPKLKAILEKKNDFIVMPNFPREVMMLTCSNDLKLRRKMISRDFVSVYGLPGPLRLLMFMRMQEEKEKANRIRFEYFDAEFYVIQSQLQIVEANESLAFDSEEVPKALLPVCRAWIQYWIFIMAQTGQVNSQIQGNTFLKKAINSYYFERKLPEYFSRQDYLNSMEETIFKEANFFVGFCRLPELSAESVRILIDRFEEYHNALKVYFSSFGFDMKVFEAIVLHLSILKYERGSSIKRTGGSGN